MTRVLVLRVIPAIHMQIALTELAGSKRPVMYRATRVKVVLDKQARCATSD